MESLWNVFVRIHDAIRVKYLLQLLVNLEDLRGFLKMKIFWFVKTDSMLSADATLLLCYFLKYIRILELLTFLENNIDMKVSISNMPISKYLCLCLLFELFKH